MIVFELLKHSELLQVIIVLERPLLLFEILLNLFADAQLADSKPALEETIVVEAVARQAKQRVNDH